METRPTKNMMRRVTDELGQVDAIGYADGRAEVIVRGWPRAFNPEEARALAGELELAASMAEANAREAGGGAVPRSPAMAALAVAVAKAEGRGDLSSADAVIQLCIGLVNASESRPK